MGKKAVGIIRPLEQRTIEVSLEDGVDPREAIATAVPDGWQLLQVRVQRD